jgi:cytochrome c biogenesis protein CcmG/thiol:disulfide interchange protein DsbE
MASRLRAFFNGRLFYPTVAVVLIGALAGLSRCPRTHPMAQDFSLPVVGPDGHAGPDRVHLADQRGKVVLLDFWATWCGPCARATPALVQLSHRFRSRGLVVVGVNVDQEGPEIVPAFMRRYGVDYPVVYDNNGVSDRYNVRNLPTTVLIDRQGRIRSAHAGTDIDDLTSEIESLL